MKNYVKPTLKVIDLKPEESIGTSTTPCFKNVGNGNCSTFIKKS